ncbi:hypothetical protein DDD64_01700 [Actinotignum sanguinis]|uniref:hypothetical protein n=1 Tax=Actinotignum sanguinis TaxID=1445614 RepID=UPI000F7F552A|nr:hypothetical protein [Actinotignum sanguinis]MDY5147615.1 hypothetical protein [Actinotignum sanguinis]RTE51337.1 hypothetical protein DDD64_01700 [Actinotignum sanguinis]
MKGRDNMNDDAARRSAARAGAVDSSHVGRANANHAGRENASHAGAAAEAQLPEARLGRLSLFDLRTWIAIMFGVFGIMLAGYGLFFVTEEDLAKAAGINLNLWTGLAMIIVAIFFAARSAAAPRVLSEALGSRLPDDETEPTAPRES